jgi:hypothetical protein
VSGIVTPAEAAAVAQRAGLCGAVSVLGFVCTRGHGHPPNDHRATALGGEEDGRLYEVWPVNPAP